MDRPLLHVQNIYDALNPRGNGVTGYLKLKCLQVTNRVVGFAGPGDFAAVSDDCPQSFLDYLLPLRHRTDVRVLRFEVSRDLRRYLNNYTLFEALSRAPSWNEVTGRKPVLAPYMHSASVYRAARVAGIPIPRKTWKVMVTERVAEQMNDKAVLYRECDELGVPVPRYWVLTDVDLVEQVVRLLRRGCGPLYIRRGRSTGALGNVTVERIGTRYRARELEERDMSKREFTHVLDHFVRGGYWNEFVVAELLDLYASPGTLFFADDKELRIISHTYQILSAGRKFHGFMFPIVDPLIVRHFEEVEGWMRRIVEPWRALGFRGYGNIDWMITTEGRVYIAEMNARQTAVMPPLKLENDIAQGMHGTTGPVVAPRFSVFARDKVGLSKPSTFEDVYGALKDKGLLWEQRDDETGVIIMTPPSPAFGINSAGIMALARNVAAAASLFDRALKALNAEEEEFLFRVA